MFLYFLGDFILFSELLSEESRQRIIISYFVLIVSRGWNRWFTFNKLAHCLLDYSFIFNIHRAENRKTNDLFVFFTQKTKTVDLKRNKSLKPRLVKRRWKVLFLPYEEQCKCSHKWHYGSTSVFIAFRNLNTNVHSVFVWLTRAKA